MTLALNEAGAVVFAVAVALLSTIGVIVLINALVFVWTNRRQR